MGYSIGVHEARSTKKTCGVLAVGALAWSVTSSLWIYPHSMSYFNELAGGPRNGHRYLIGSNLDWGQDVLYLKEWSAKHPDAEPLNLLPKNSFCPDLLGRRDWEQHPMVPEASSQRRVTRNGHVPALGPQPGWYAASIHRIYDPGGQYRYLLDFKPVATAGYGIYIYNITRDEANRVRGELGLPELAEDWEEAAQNHDR